MRLPKVTAAEWHAIEPALPAHHGAGRPRTDDRAFVSAFCYCAATGCSLASLPAGYPNPRSLQTRRSRWQQAGIWTPVMTAAAASISRMRNEYWGAICDASDVSSPNWKTSSEFFGHGAIPKASHLSPKGRYADRRR
jgi:transposase